MDLNFLGRKDAFALTAIAGGLVAMHPYLAGNPIALPMAMGVGVGVGMLTWERAKQMLVRVNTSVREKFVLKSDEAFGEFIGTKGLRLGYTTDDSIPLDIANDLLVRHTAIVGQSGVGKTVLGEFLLWQQAVRGGGWLFLDAKIDKDTRNKLFYMMKLIGREDDFYVLNVNEPELSNTYNPILEGDADEIASRLLNLLPSSESSPGADFYRQQANYALTVIIGALKAAKYRYHFSDLAIMMQSEGALGKLERIVPPGPEKRSLQIFLNQFKKKSKEGTMIDINKIKEVLGGMSGRIALFAQGKFGKVFNTYTPEVDLTQIVKNNKFLYVMLPTMGKDTAALNLGKMILSDLRTAVANLQDMREVDRPDPPFLIFADEMGAYVMQGVARLFEQARSAGIMMMPAFQAFSQLNTVSPDFADIIIQNTWNKVFFKFASDDSTTTAIEILGKTVKYSKSLSVGEGESTGAQTTRTDPTANQGSSLNVGMGWREVEDYRVTADQLKAMGIGEAVVISGSRVFHIKTPRLGFSKRLPEFQVCRHHIKVPSSEKVLDFEKEYKQFLLDAGGVAPNEAPAYED